MDHDSVEFDLPGPVSYRVEDVRLAYEALTIRGLNIMDERIAKENQYSSNKDGHFAWDISYLIRAACIAWRVSRDSEHLKRACRWAQHMIERTDDKIGRVDWRKDSNPAWSAGSRYTAGTVTVGRVEGTPIQLQAASERVIIERPTPNTAIIRSIRKGGEEWSSLEGSLLSDSPDYLPDLLARRSSVHAVLLRGLNSPMDLRFLASREFSLVQQFAAHFVHTGMIARSLICAAEALEAAGNRANDSDVSPIELYEAARRALMVHDDEILARAGQYWYITPADFPSRRLGLEVPHNHVVDAATSFIILGRKFRDIRLGSLGVSLTRPWLHELAMLERGDLPHPWYYYPFGSDSFKGVVRDSPVSEREVTGVQRGEDSSHAIMRVRALLEWQAIDPQLVGGKTLKLVALAFRKNYMTSKSGLATLRWLPAAPNDRSDKARLGHADTYSGAWGALHRWDPRMKRRINLMAYSHPPQRVFGATVLSAAEIVAMNAELPTNASYD